MPVSAAQKRANNKYNAEHMTILGCKVRKEYAQEVKDACAANGDTVNAVIKRALDDYLSKRKN